MCIQDFKFAWKRDSHFVDYNQQRQNCKFACAVAAVPTNEMRVYIDILFVSAVPNKNVTAPLTLPKSICAQSLLLWLKK